jgi:hypothetical protein
VLGCIGMIGAVRTHGIAADARCVGAFDEAQG